MLARQTHGIISFFTCDTQIDSEQEMLAKGYDLKADILTVVHHGSNAATSDEFLKAIAAKYAVIMLGKDNAYGRPHMETLVKLNAAGVNIYSIPPRRQHPKTD